MIIMEERERERERNPNDTSNPYANCTQIIITKLIIMKERKKNFA